MKLFKIEIPKSKLYALSEDEQVFFVQMAHFLNELNVLQKAIIISSNKMTSLTPVEKRAQISQALFFIRMLAGKLNEGWKMVEKNFFSTLSGEYEKRLSSTGEDSLSKLKRYFRSKNIVYLIRNKFAFHYDSKKIKEEIDKIPQSEILEMFISDHGGNCLYSFSDIIVNWAILNSIDSSNPQQAMDRLIQEIAIEVSGWFQEFGGDCLKITAEKLDLYSPTEIEIPDPPPIDEVKLPYFVERPINKLKTIFDDKTS